jgi:hypothetical protein
MAHTKHLYEICAGPCAVSGCHRTTSELASKVFEQQWCEVRRHCSDQARGCAGMLKAHASTLQNRHDYMGPCEATTREFRRGGERPEAAVPLKSRTRLSCRRTAWPTGSGQVLLTAGTYLPVTASKSCRPTCFACMEDPRARGA